jgi:hypothetical protein
MDIKSQQTLESSYMKENENQSEENKYNKGKQHIHCQKY